MRELTLKEILYYAANIEKESFNFYTSALKVAKEQNVKDLLNELANAEVGHLNRIEKLKKEKITSIEELKKSFKVDDRHITELINIPSFENNAKEEDILKTALDREKKTYETYSMFLSLTNLNQDTIDLFEELKQQKSQQGVESFSSV